MIALVQRVTEATVTTGDHRAAIGTGLCVLLGVEQGDTEQEATWIATKLARLRIFRGELPASEEPHQHAGAGRGIRFAPMHGVEDLLARDLLGEL